MRIRTEIFQGVFVATCDGTRLDASLAQVFFNSMRNAIEKGHTDIVLDLSSVKFVDSTGLGAIVRCLKEINNRGHLVLCGVNESVLSLLKMTHLDAVFLRAESRETAFELLRVEKEKSEAELAAAASAPAPKNSFKGFDDSLLSSLSMEEGEPILEVDNKEKRRHRRVGHKQIINNDIVVYITHKGTSKRTAAIILNVSASGVLVVSPSKHSVGEKFMMSGSIGSQFKLEEQVVIRNCREGKYGFEFINPSPKTLNFLHQMVGSVVLDGKIDNG